MFHANRAKKKHTDDKQDTPASATGGKSEVLRKILKYNKGSAVLATSLSALPGTKLENLVRIRL
jgi:hypothetical protein